MAYDEKLADRVRELLVTVKRVEEKKMFRGLTFMVNGKMCVSVSGMELMCRIDPALTDEMLERNGIRGMIRLGKLMKGFIYVSAGNLRTKNELNYWVKLCLDFNERAKKTKKKKS